MGNCSRALGSQNWFALPAHRQLGRCSGRAQALLRRAPLMLRLKQPCSLPRTDVEFGEIGLGAYIKYIYGVYKPRYQSPT